MIVLIFFLAIYIIPVFAYPNSITTMTIQQIINNIISKIPHLIKLVSTLSFIDYAVMGSIALVIVMVIASVARNKSNKLDCKRQQS